VVGHSTVDEGAVGGGDSGRDVELGPERGRRNHRQQGAQRHLQYSHRNLKENVLTCEERLWPISYKLKDPNFQLKTRILRFTPVAVLSVNIQKIQAPSAPCTANWRESTCYGLH
jgi:hypothetical protein